MIDMRGSIGIGYRLVLGAVLAASLLLGGCATSLTADKMPGVDLAGISSLYVRKLPADGRGIDRLISEQLVAMGRSSSYGSEAKPPRSVDAIVTYQDRWYWDITMYMLSLAIQVRDPQTDVPLATGNALRTSLVRKSPEEMVKDVLTQIFNPPAGPAK
jgi:hypothetical protein